MEQIGIVGLGYVGLPLAVEFGKKMPVIGFDINKERIGELKMDLTVLSKLKKRSCKKHQCSPLSYDPADLKNACYFIITVPTPVDEFKKPELTPLIKASETVGRVLKKTIL